MAYMIKINAFSLCRFLLTFSILQYLIGFILLSNNVGTNFVFTDYFPIHLFRLVSMFSGITPQIILLFELFPLQRTKLVPVQCKSNRKD
jgi:hypothetical protein